MVHGIKHCVGARVRQETVVTAIGHSAIFHLYVDRWQTGFAVQRKPGNSCHCHTPFSCFSSLCRWVANRFLLCKENQTQKRSYTSNVYRTVLQKWGALQRDRIQHLLTMGTGTSEDFFITDNSKTNLLIFDFHPNSNTVTSQGFYNKTISQRLRSKNVKKQTSLFMLRAQSPRGLGGVSLNKNSG
jgi:hypothetical protein